jgi:hypothetical protein
MLRALFIGLVVSAAMAIAARLIARWRFGGRGRDIRRLAPHGAVEYGSFVLMIAAASAMTLVQRGETGSAIAVPLALTVLLVAVVDAYAVFITQMFWTNDGLGAWDPLRKQRFIRWADVTSWKASWHGTYVSDGRGTIGVAPWRVGTAELRRFLEARHGGARRP